MEKKEIKKQNNQYGDLVATQTNPESKQLMYTIVNSDLVLNQNLVNYMLFLSNKPDRQRKLMSYVSIPDIIYDEYYTFYMLNVDNDFLEHKLKECFKKGLIKNKRDLMVYTEKFCEQLDDSQGFKKVLTI